MGFFVVFEGIDGSGKSTAIAEIDRRLTGRGISTRLLREPTEKTDASREIRRILRTVKDISARVNDELLDLFLIDRLWDINTQIKPALLNDGVVLLDRYYLSTAAYQAANPPEMQKIMTGYLNDVRILDPDLVIFLNLPVKIALERLKQRRELDVFESETRLTGIAHRYAEAIAVFRRERQAIAVIERKNILDPADFDDLANAIASNLINKIK